MLQVELIQPYFPEISGLQIEKITDFSKLVSDWNKKINLISRKDIDNLSVNHILHSLALAKIIRFKPGSIILDFGTGGGFPGIPLAIYFETSQFVLVDSIQKKINVLENIKNELQLSNVKTICNRGELIQDKFDFIVSRSVTTLPQLLKWTNFKFNSLSQNELENGYFIYKGGEIENELKTINKKIIQFNLENIYKELYFCEKKIIYIQS